MSFDDIRRPVFSPDKQWAYLARARTIRVASLGENSRIRLLPNWFVVHERRLVLVVDKPEQADDLLAGRAFSAVVDDGEDYRSLHGLAIDGRARVLEDPDLLEWVPQALFDKYFHVGHPHAESYFEFGAWVGRRYLEILPERMEGWDLREETHPQYRERRSFPRPLSDRIYQQ